MKIHVTLWELVCEYASRRPNAFFVILLGLCVVFITAAASFGQCYGPGCVPQPNCPGGVCPAPQQECPGGVCPVPGVNNHINLNAVLRVRAAEGRGMMSKGSGAVVRWGDAVVFLTAHHVIQDAPDNVEVLHAGQWHRIYRVFSDPVYDYAVYTAPDCVEPLPFGVPNGMQPGTALIVSGFGGRSDTNRVKFAAVFQQMMRPSKGGAEADWMRLEGAAISGDSGGPVLTTDGTVIGVLWGASQPRNETLATHGRRIAASLNDIVSRYTKCNYYDSGLCRPNPRTVGRSPSRIPVPDSQTPTIIRPITPTEPVAPMLPPPVSEPVTIHVQDNSVVSAWVGDLNSKVDQFGQRLDAVEQAAGVAIAEAGTLMGKAAERINSVETRAMLLDDEMKRIPEKIHAISQEKTDLLGKQLRGEAETVIQKARDEAGLMGQSIRNDFVAALQIDKEQRPAEMRTIANAEAKSWIPVAVLGGTLLAAIVCIIILLARRKLDARDGNPDGYVDFDAMKENRRRRRNAPNEIDAINEKLDALLETKAAT